MIDFGAHEWTIALPIPTSPLNRNRETSEFEGAITLPGACKILTRRLTRYPIHNTILISACSRRISQLSCWNSLHFLPLSGKILSLLIYPTPATEPLREACREAHDTSSLEPEIRVLILERAHNYVR